MEFKEIYARDYPNNKRIPFHYVSDSIYTVAITPKPKAQGWVFDWTLQHLTTTFEKQEEEPLFKEYKQGAHYYLILNNDGEERGAFVFGPQQWNRLTRLYDLYVDGRYRRQGVGTRVMEFVKCRAESMGTRGLILECQSTNFPAINFYREQGFELIGFDLVAYTGEKMNPQEKRFEMAYLFLPR